MLDAELLALGRWIAQYYCAPLGEVLRGMTPLSGEVRKTKLYSLTDAGRDAARQLLLGAAERRSRAPSAAPAGSAAALGRLSAEETAERRERDSIARKEGLRRRSRIWKRTRSAARLRRAAARVLVGFARPTA